MGTFWVKIVNKPFDLYAILWLKLDEIIIPNSYAVISTPRPLFNKKEGRFEQKGIEPKKSYSIAFFFAT